MDKWDGFGISWLWGVDQSRYTPAAITHDYEYQQHHLNLSTKTRANVDYEFLQDMLLVSRTKIRIAKAYAIYALVRSLGWIWWNN